jgi:hypothetical protein
MTAALVFEIWSFFGAWSLDVGVWECHRETPENLWSILPVGDVRQGHEIFRSLSLSGVSTRALISHGIVVSYS